MGKWRHLPDGRTVLKNSKPSKTPIFVMVLKETLDSPAWKAMSHGARSLYIALKRRYNQTIHNNGRIYLAQRKAAEEIGSDTHQVTRWFRELQHYGFIVLERPGCLGVDGKGHAPQWRLTEVGHMNDPPTREFMDWQLGNSFIAHSRNPHKKTESRRRKHRHPVGETTHKAASVKAPTPRGTSVGESHHKASGQSVGETTHKSRLPSPRLGSGSSGTAVWVSNANDELAILRRRHEELTQLVEAAAKPNGRVH
jgi:hypothetical protein